MVCTTHSMTQTTALRTEELSRHTIDRIARALVSGRRGYGERVDRIADLVAGLMRNRLEAVGARGAKCVRRSRWTDAAPQDRQALGLLLDRVEKHLAWLVLAEGGSGSAQPH